MILLVMVSERKGSMPADLSIDAGSIRFALNANNKGANLCSILW